MPSPLGSGNRLGLRRPCIKGYVRAAFVWAAESVLADVKPAEMTSADVFVFDVMNQQLLDRFNAQHQVDLIASVKQRGTVRRLTGSQKPARRESQVIQQGHDATTWLCKANFGWPARRNRRCTRRMAR